MNSSNLTWDRPVTEKLAHRRLLTAILMYKKAGMTLWVFIKLVAKIWENTDEELREVIRRHSGIKEND